MKSEKELICEYLSHNNIKFTCDSVAFCIENTGIKKYFSDFSIQNEKIIKKADFLKNENEIRQVLHQRLPQTRKMPKIRHKNRKKISCNL